jgi:hypothetical protein
MSLLFRQACLLVCGAAAAGLLVPHAGAQAVPSVTAADPAQVITLANSLSTYPRVRRTSEGDTTETSQAMTSHTGCRVVLTFKETGEDWQVDRVVHADLGLLDSRVTIDRETEDRDIENVEDTLPFPWRLEVRTKSGAKDIEVHRTDVKNGHPTTTVTFGADRMQFLLASQAGSDAVSNSLTAAIAACSMGPR